LLKQNWGYWSNTGIPNWQIHFGRSLCPTYALFNRKYTDIYYGYGLTNDPVEAKYNVEFFKGQHVAPHSPHYFIKMMLMKNISSVITMVILTYNCVLQFSILVSVGSQKCSLL